MENKNSVAVVGAGVAGLSAAALLARSGLRVTVFDASDKIGGCCGQTVCGGYIFNDGALYLAFPRILDHVFERLGRDRRSVLPLRRITALQRTELPDGVCVTLADGAQLRVTRRDGSSRDVPYEELAPLLERWQPVFDLFADDLLRHPFSLVHTIRRGWRHLHKLRGSVALELSRLIGDEAVRSALSGALLYTGLPAQNTPAPAMLGLVALLSDGFYLPEGGMGRIPEALWRCFDEAGGTLTLGAKVRRIIVNRGRVRGIYVDGCGVIDADFVLSTVHASATFGRLLEEGVVPGNLRRKAQAAPLSHRALALQIGLSNRVEDASHINCVLPWMHEQSAVFRPSPDEVRWLNYSVPTVTMPELAAAGGGIIEAFPAIPQELPLDAWDERERQRVVQPMLEALSHRHRLQIATTRIISPRDFRDKLHLFQGAVYGLSPTADPRAQFPHRTPVPGLYQAGQTTYPGFGVASAAMSGILAVDALLRRERLD